MERRISNRKECIQFLREKGTKVAIQVGYEGEFVFAEKTDFINVILKGGAKHGLDLCDYDGGIEFAWVQQGVLHIPVGVS